jgi:diguanylate cyclase (GGDEF)-like protein
MAATKAVDPVTGLPSPASFFLALELAASEAQRSGTPLSVLVVDIDRFDELREKAGLEMADAALLRTSKLLRLALGRDGVLARLTGDQFGVMLVGETIVQAQQRGEAVRLAIELQLGAGQRRLTASVGVASGAAGIAWSGDELIVLAGRRRDAAKLAGRNRVWAWGHPGIAMDQRAAWPEGIREMQAAPRASPFEQLSLF